jgi:hypothetical protein
VAVRKHSAYFRYTQFSSLSSHRFACALSPHAVPLPGPVPGCPQDDEEPRLWCVQSAQSVSVLHHPARHASGRGKENMEVNRRCPCRSPPPPPCLRTRTLEHAHAHADLCIPLHAHTIHLSIHPSIYLGFTGCARMHNHMRVRHTLIITERRTNPCSTSPPPGSVKVHRDDPVDDSR